MAEPSGKRVGIGEGIRTGIGILAALKDAVEDTFQEAVDRGDLAPERAGDAVQSVLRRVQDAMGDVKDRLDVVPRREFDELRGALADLAGRVDALEHRPPAGADRLLPPL